MISHNITRMNLTGLVMVLLSPYTSFVSRFGFADASFLAPPSTSFSAGLGDLTSSFVAGPGGAIGATSVRVGAEGVPVTPGAEGAGLTLGCGA